MRWFHHHTWERRMVTYAPPSMGDFKVRGIDAWTYQTLILGVTTCLRECSVCHVQETVQMLGKQTET